MTKVYISPSMQEYNKYATGDTTEAKQCHRIGEALYKALIRCGINAKLAPLDQAAEKNVSESNKFGADYHICIHTNAANTKARDVVVFAHEKQINDPCVQGVYRCVDAVDGHTSIYGVRKANYYEIAYTDAICIYVECEFHDNKELAQFIIDHADEYGEAIAKGICEGLKIPYISNKEEIEMPRYQTINDVPAYYRPYIQKLMDRGIIKGKGDGVIDLTEDMIRTMIFCMRIMGEE